MNRLVLASGSATRRAMLSSAGLAVVAVSPDVDEAVIKREARAEGRDAMACARLLAEAKALAVSAGCPDDLVIGADQMLSTPDGLWFDKPAGREAARIQLLSLAGRDHALLTAVAVAKGERILWTAGDRAVLVMRRFSEAFVDDYLARAGDAVLSSVGAYQLEGLGVQLFERVDGDHFTILGLPLLPLLDFLRREGVLTT